MVYDYYILSTLLFVQPGGVKLGRGQCGDSSFVVTINNTGNEILIISFCVLPILPAIFKFRIFSGDFSHQP